MQLQSQSPFPHFSIEGKSPGIEVQAKDVEISLKPFEHQRFFIRYYYLTKNLSSFQMPLRTRWRGEAEHSW